MQNLLSLASRLVFSYLEAEALSGDPNASRQHFLERLITDPIFSTGREMPGEAALRLIIFLHSTGESIRLKLSPEQPEA
jgi:hypothetical protein